jgi:magnesium-transporting ATPase (P-type)
LMLFNQKIISFQILYNFEFDSDRKRSTVIVQHNN